jgi:DNA replication protein DnaC
MKIFVAKTILEKVMNLREKVTKDLEFLKQYGMSDALDQQFESDKYEEMSFMQRLSPIVTEQVTLTCNTKITRLLKQSNIRWKHASLGDIDYVVQKGLKKSVIADLGEMEWLKNHRHIIITGPAGVGKTYVASAFGMQAIMQYTSVISCRFGDLLLKLVAAESDKRHASFKNKIEKIPLLIIDDWRTAPLSITERHLLFELIEKRDQNSSLIITSQFPIGEWYDGFGDPTVADSTLDRIVHCAHKINMKGESFRRLMGIKGGVK